MTLSDKICRRKSQVSSRSTDFNRAALEAIRHAYDSNAKRISRLEQVVQQLSSELENESSSTKRPRSKRKRPLHISEKQLPAFVCARKE